MAFFSYSEFKYYSFGLKAGVMNFLRNGLRLGLKKTIGKVTQPINSYTRFPEYDYFAKAINRHISVLNARAKILDIGSPKLLGLYLAVTNRVEVTLSDISALNIDEYRYLWNALKPKAKGDVTFALHDARALQIPNEHVDVAYSMSVIEHVEGNSGDSDSIRELIRVLKPGGLLIISVPFGPRYVEQQRTGLVGAAQRTNDDKSYFFQRIYDEASFNTRIMAQAPSLEKITLTTVWRVHRWAHRAFASLGDNVRGALGLCNPFLSRLANKSCAGINNSFHADYGDIYSASNIYGDLILVGRKRNSDEKA